MKKVEIQRKLWIEYLKPENKLAYVLVHEKGLTVHQQYLKTPVGYYTNKNFNVKNKSTLSIRENQKSRNCGQKIEKALKTPCKRKIM